MLVALYVLMTLCGTQRDVETCTERSDEDSGDTDADKTCLLYWAFCSRLEKPVSYPEELQRGNLLQGANSHQRFDLMVVMTEMSFHH